MFQRSVVNIDYNGEQQSSDQDIRLLSTDETDRNPLMMFYTNSRRHSAKEYVQVAGTLHPDLFCSLTNLLTINSIQIRRYQTRDSCATREDLTAEL